MSTLPLFRRMSTLCLVALILSVSCSKKNDDRPKPDPQKDNSVYLASVRSVTAEEVQLDSLTYNDDRLLLSLVKTRKSIYGDDDTVTFRFRYGGNNPYPTGYTSRDHWDYAEHQLKYDYASRIVLDTIPAYKTAVRYNYIRNYIICNTYYHDGVEDMDVDTLTLTDHNVTRQRSYYFQSGDWQYYGGIDATYSDAPNPAFNNGLTPVIGPLLYFLSLDAIAFGYTDYLSLHLAKQIAGSNKVGGAVDDSYTPSLDSLGRVKSMVNAAGSKHIYFTYHKP